MKRVLVVEDDKKIGKLIKRYFENNGFEVVLEEDGIDGYARFKGEEYNLLILDVMLPGMNGFEITKRVRKISRVPIIMVTARGADEDQLLGYEYKVDDYVTKPFNPEILVAKARNILERMSDYAVEVKEECFIMDDFKVNFLNRKVFIEEEEVPLEPKQYDILNYLIQNKNKVITRGELLDKIWGYDYFGSDRVVDTQIRKLRKKLIHKAYLIKTAFSVGYSFEEQ